MRSPALRAPSGRDEPLSWLVVLMLVVVAACGVERPPYGGEPEQALATRRSPRMSPPSQACWPPAPIRTRWCRFRTEAVAVVPRARSGPAESAADDRDCQGMLAKGARPKSRVGHERRGRQASTRILLAEIHERVSRRRHRVDFNPFGSSCCTPVPDVVPRVARGGRDPRSGRGRARQCRRVEEDEIARLLVDAGVDVNCHPSITPLVAAVEARNVPLMTYLEEHGAREKP